jgi:hypothetical protein
MNYSVCIYKVFCFVLSTRITMAAAGTSNSQLSTSSLDPPSPRHSSSLLLLIRCIVIVSVLQDTLTEKVLLQFLKESEVDVTVK